ncbi:SIS domain-containing protein [Leptolyngbyaceae cyanobacterium UHCC 1019]
MNSNLPTAAPANQPYADDLYSDNLCGFPHFMLKEIQQQPESVQICLAHYFHAISEPLLSVPVNLNEVHILACGTSYHAGLITQHWIEQLVNIPVRVRSGSEFQEAPLPMTANTLTIGITQSGETADTLNAIALDKQRRLAQSEVFQPHLLGITNQPNSALSQRVDWTMPTLAGTEIGVAATKTFLNQLIVCFYFTLELALSRQAISPETVQAYWAELSTLPAKIRAVLQLETQIKPIAQAMINQQHCMVLGRGINQAIALEGALKLKETTYLHAEGYSAGEFMHGPIALLDERVPVIAIAPTDSTHAAMIANLRQVKSHGSPIIGILTEDVPPETASLFDHVLILPAIADPLSPILSVIPLQLLAYHLAVQRGLNVDKPRNITKTLSE